MRRSATLKEIARIAGVSAATVSRTLSNPDLVAEATRTAVLSAVATTGYRVNHTARNLRRRRTGSVIALVPNLANPFFSQILSGMAEVLSEADTGLLVADTRAGADPSARLAAYLANGMADGLIVLDGTLAEGALTAGGPVVCACEWLGTLPSVRADNHGGAVLAVRHLVAAGHRAIGHATGPRGNVLTETRLAGWRAGLAEAGLAAPDAHLFEGDFSLASGARVAAAWQAMEPDERPTAMFLSSDEMAAGFAGALQNAGVAVPADVSVVGFDDIEVAAHLTPPLTTIRQPRAEIGARAARRLLALIDAGPGGGAHGGPGGGALHDGADGTGACGVDLVPVELIARASVAPPATRHRAPRRQIGSATQRGAR